VEEREFDIVVAADGVRSRVRGWAIGEESPPVYSGAEVFYGIAPGPVSQHEWGSPRDEDGGWCVQALGEGASFISAPCRIVRTHSAFPSLAGKGDKPVNSVYYGFVCHVPEKEREEEGRVRGNGSRTRSGEGSEAREEWENQAGLAALRAAGGPQSAGFVSRNGDGGAGDLSSQVRAGDEHKDVLWSLVKDGRWGAFARDLVETTPSGRLLRFKMYYRKPFPTWHAGRVVLLGDAAHAPLPTIGQGLNMAAEDGFSLGTHIARALRGRGDAPSASGAGMDAAVGEAFSAYTAQRHSKTGKMVFLSRMLLQLESGITSPLWLSRARTALVARTIGMTVDQLREQIRTDPVTTEAALRQLLLAGSSS
jgi:2-polyprenyl-6-methoxyphenol hydroxylase-like FAD-dependent oxidoreductase